jgi:hypothetical protein
MVKLRLRLKDPPQLRIRRQFLEEGAVDLSHQLVSRERL